MNLLYLKMAYSLRIWNIREELLPDESIMNTFGGEASKNEVDNVFEESEYEISEILESHENDEDMEDAMLD